MKFAKFLRTPFSTEHLRWLLLIGAALTKKTLNKHLAKPVHVKCFTKQAHNEVCKQVNCRQGFRSQSNIYDEAFGENSLPPSAIYDLQFTHHQRCLTGL